MCGSPRCCNNKSCERTAVNEIHYRSIQQKTTRAVEKDTQCRMRPNDLVRSWLSSKIELDGKTGAPAWPDLEPES